ncbi:MAG: hypothetical protein OSA99_20755 [Acidimicrobiales bacterium]|nr:hypothetical protein [Acidimicrobiales bacterium]
MVLVAAVILVAACNNDEGCNAVGISTDLVVDVSALPDANEVCLDRFCVNVRDGRAHFAEDISTNASPLPKPMTDADLEVNDASGRLVRSAEEIEVPGYYADGGSCGSYAPVGTVVVESDDVTHTDDIVE